mgnify:CR=1 FL=1
MKIGLLPAALLEIAIATYLGLPPSVSVGTATLMVGVGTAIMLRSYRTLKMAGAAVLLLIAQQAVASFGLPSIGWLSWVTSPTLPLIFCAVTMVLCALLALFDARDPSEGPDCV